MDYKEIFVISLLVTTDQLSLKLLLDQEMRCEGWFSVLSLDYL